jgi:feruloyl esterase
MKAHMLVGLTLSPLAALIPTINPIAAGQNAPSQPVSMPDAQKCAALTNLNLEDAPGGPAVITAARLVDVPPSGLEHWVLTPSGFGDAVEKNVGRIREYCEVTGYVAPQNKFELKLPLPSDWNQNFFFYACGAYFGTVFGDACNLGLARRYASLTGNGGHDSACGFDGVWAANAPELQEDFGWRSNHVITLIAKAITTHYYGKPIKYSYMAGTSKGGPCGSHGGATLP